MTSFLAEVSQVLLLIVGLFMILIILLQRGRGGGLAGAFGGMGGQSAFGTRAGDVFTKITCGIAVAWVLLAGFSGRWINNSVNAVGEGEYKPQSEISAREDADKPTTPGGGLTPTNPSGGSLLPPTGTEDKPESGAATPPTTETPAATTPAQPEAAAPPAATESPASTPEPAKPEEAKPQATEPDAAPQTPASEGDAAAKPAAEAPAGDAAPPAENKP